MRMISNFRSIFSVLATIVAPTLAQSAEMEVNGTTLNFDEAGAGSVVLFVHGAISDRRVWAPYSALISSERRFVAYDQRYFGARDWTDAGALFSADTHAADLVAFVEALDAGPVNLVAWSYGGDVAARAALSRPDLFRSLVQYEPDVAGLLDGVPGAIRATDNLYAGFDPAFTAIEKNQLEDASLRFIDAVFGLPEGGADKEPLLWREIWTENGRTIPLYLNAPSGEAATCPALARLRLPTLVVKGANGHVYDAMMADRVAACQPNAIVITMAGVNHDGPYRRSNDFAEKIDSFLDLLE